MEQPFLLIPEGTDTRRQPVHAAQLPALSTLIKLWLGLKKNKEKNEKPQTQPSHPQNKKPQIHPYSLSLTIQPQAAWSRALWPCLAYQQYCKSLKIAWGHTVVVWSPLTLSVPWPHLQMLNRSAGLEGHSQALAADRSNVAASFVSETKQDRRLQLYKYKPNGFF